MRLRAFAVVAALLFFPAVVVLADTDVSGTTRKWEEAAQILTRAVPTAATEGMSIQDVDAFRVIVCAASGQTLSGAGVMQAYVWDNDLALWARNPSLDLSITVTATSCQGAACRCQAFPDMKTGSPSGRLLYASNGVTESGGTTLDVVVKAWTVRGK